MRTAACQKDFGMRHAGRKEKNMKDRIFDKFNAKNMAMGITGLLLVGFGSGMLVKTGYGADTLNAIFTGVARLTGLSVGTVSAIVNGIMLVFIFFVQRELVGIGMFLSVLVLKFPIDFAIAVYPASPNLAVGVCSDILSFVVFCLGVALMMESELGVTGYDGLTLIATNKSKKPFRTVRLICDGITLGLAFLLKGEIGVGTVLGFLLMAPFIDFFRKRIEKVL